MNHLILVLIAGNVPSGTLPTSIYGSELPGINGLHFDERKRTGLLTTNNLYPVGTGSPAADIDLLLNRSVLV